jgi:hypothetical protein
MRTEQERVVGRDSRTEVAQGHRAHAQGVGDGCQRLGQIVRPAQTVVVAVWLVEERETRVALPLELARIGDDAADGRTMAAQPFGQRVHHDVGAMLDGAQQVRRRKGGIDDEWKSVLVRDLGHRAYVGEIEHRVADGLDEDGAGLFVDGLGEVLGILGIHQVHLDAQLGKNGVELRNRSTIEIVGGDDLVARFSQGDDGVEDGRGPRGHRHRGRAAFELRHALLEDVGGGIHQAGIDVAQLLEREEVGGVLRVLEDIGGRPVDRYPARHGCVRGLSRVQGQGFKSVGLRAHGLSSLR